MDEPERPPPHAGKPLTGDDVVRLIEEHGGPEGLDLRQADLELADLSGLDLHGADLVSANLQRAYLARANLQGAYLTMANLQRAHMQQATLQGAVLRWTKLQGADLERADLRKADLLEANLQQARLHNANLQQARLHNANLQQATLGFAQLEQADLLRANLQDAYLSAANLFRARLTSANLQGADLAANLEAADLRGADLRRARLAYATLRDADFEGANWGDYVLAEEIRGDFDEAASSYRTLKQRHTEAGMYDIAGEFHYREMEARRKLAQKQVRIPDVLALNLFRLLFGYGERPIWVGFWAAAVIFGLALVHWLFGTVAGGFLDALYFSAVSFTALGYGEWAPEPQGWAGRFLGAAESFMGVFMIALFLVTFTRKMTR